MKSYNEAIEQLAREMFDNDGQHPSSSVSIVVSETYNVLERDVDMDIDEAYQALVIEKAFAGV